MRGAQILGVLIACALTAFREKLVSANPEDEIRLGVTIRNREMLDRAPSCMHTFSRVELVNQHNSEVVIKSIGLSKETTIRIEIDDSGELEEIIYETLPQQVHASEVSDNFLTLDPGQGAIVPLTFLPRFPPPTPIGDIPTNMPEEMNDWLQADREEWHGSVRVRNNIGHKIYKPEVYSITAMLLVDTNYGVAKIPFDASSVRDNPYALPDIIYFDTARVDDMSMAPHLKQPQYSADNHIRIVDSYWNMNTGNSLDLEPDCYDLYLKHPRESFSSIDMQVQEILVSRPENVSVQIKPEKAPGNDLISTSPQHVIREWTEDGPLLIPPDDDQHYIATICTELGEGVKRDKDVDQYVKEKAFWLDDLERDGSLGFVQIRTDSETLFISLAELGDVSNETWTLSYYANSYLRDEDEEEDETPQNVSLEAYPEKVRFVMLEKTADTASVAIDVQNMGTGNLTVMRLSVAFEEYESRVLQDCGVNINVSPLALEKRGWNIGPEGFMDDAFSVSASWDWISLDSNETDCDLNITGKIIIQSSANYSLSRPWIEATRLDPILDAELAVEFPLSVQFVRGAIGVSRYNATIQDDIFFLYNDTVHWMSEIGTIEGFAFPFYNTDLDSTFEKHGIMHTLTTLENWMCVYSTVANISFTVTDVTIVDEKGSLVSNSGAGVCARFKIRFGWWEKMNFPYGQDFDIVDVGMMHLEYNFPLMDDAMIGTKNIYPTECMLRFSTLPETGTHTIPLIVYPGRAHISVDSAATNGVTTDFAYRNLAYQNRVQPVFGFAGLLDWYQNSTAGKAFHDLLSTKRGEADDAVLFRYLHSLSKSGYDPDISTISPVLLKIGAINPDEKESFPLYITNYNPVPLLLTIDVGEVEGLKLSLGRDAVDTRSCILSQFEQTHKQHNNESLLVSHTGSFQDHPVEGLRQFLKTDENAQSTLFFGFRDAIDVSKDALDRFPMLRGLFDVQSVTEYHKVASLADSLSNCGDRQSPQPYSKFLSGLRGRRFPGPVAISYETKSVRALPSCKNSSDDQRRTDEIIVLPAGGAVRFDVTLQSPPLSILDNDISQFLSTGLVLTTKNREIIPILVAYETPRGRLQVSPYRGDDGVRNSSPESASHVRVAAGMFGERSPSFGSSIRIPPKYNPFEDIIIADMSPRNSNNSGDGMSLYMTSTFNRPVELLDVTSSNPLFEVVLRNQSSVDPMFGVHVGEVKNIVPCTPPLDLEKSLGLSSFYMCAINWIKGRKDTETREKARVEFRYANRAFSMALFISVWSLNDSGRRGQRRAPDGAASPALVDAVSKAFHILQTGHKYDLLRLSTTLRALVRYNSSSAEDSGDQLTPSEAHVLSLGTGNLTIDSVLEIPTLLNPKNSTNMMMTEDNIVALDFPNTFVGGVSSQMLSVSNPTSKTIKVRLAVAPPKDSFEKYLGEVAMKTPSAVREKFLTDYDLPYTKSFHKPHWVEEYASQQWWDGGGSFFQADFSGGLLRSHYNITVRAGSGAAVSLLIPGLLTNSAFIAGCGARCAVKDEIMKFDGPHDVRLSSFIGASAGQRSVLMGHRRPDLLTNGKGASPFAIPYSTLRQEVEIPPYGKAELGPILFRPPGRSNFLGCEPWRGNVLPQHCDNSGFKSVVLIENSLTGLERVLLRGKAVWERVIFEDIPLHDDDSFSEIEMRNGRDALIFPGSARFRPDGSFPVIKRLMVKNDGETPVTFTAPLLSAATKLRKEEITHVKRSCSFGEFSVHPCSSSRIQLSPGENYTFYVRYEPRCTQLSSFISLTVEFKRRQQHARNRQHEVVYGSSLDENIFRRSSRELLVGYKMDASELSSCVPSGIDIVSRSIRIVKNFGLDIHSGRLSKGLGMIFVLSFALTYICIIFAISAFGLLLVRKLLWRRTTSSLFGKRIIGGTVRSNVNLHLDSNWLATLRCLSRLDPSSQDLQNLGREQTRLVLLNQFRFHDVLPPICLNASGAFQRDKIPSARKSNNNSKSGVGSGGTERVRSLSECLFKASKPCFSSGGLGNFGVGWSTGISRGIIDDFTLNRFKVELLTDALARSRIDHPSLASEDDSEEIDEIYSTSSIGHEENSISSHHENDKFRMEHGDDTQKVEEVDSDSVRSDDEFSDGTPTGGNIPDHDGNTLPTSNTNEAASPLRDVSTSIQSEGAEFTKVTQKGKSSKRNSKSRKTRKSDSGQKNQIKNDSEEKPSGTPKIPVVKPHKPALPHTEVQKNARKKATKPANGKLSAKAPPFEPNPSAKKNTPKKSLSAKQKSQTTPQPPAGVRPPPGLAPPPGFEEASVLSPPRAILNPPASSMNTPSADASSPESIGTSPVLQPSNLPGAGRALSPILGEGLPLATAPSPVRSALDREHISTDSKNLVESLLGPQSPPRAVNSTGDNFDIMDFLDGILNEGGTPSDTTDPIEPPAIQQPDDSQPEIPTAGVSSPSLLPVPSNPWAAGSALSGNEVLSRAAAYGINFEDDANERGTSDAALAVDIPMLTPSAILGEQDEDKDTLHSSFYSSLLK